MITFDTLGVWEINKDGIKRFKKKDNGYTSISIKHISHKMKQIRFGSVFFIFINKKNDRIGRFFSEENKNKLGTFLVCPFRIGLCY